MRLMSSSAQGSCNLPLRDAFSTCDVISREDEFEQKNLWDTWFISDLHAFAYLIMRKWSRRADVTSSSCVCVHRRWSFVSVYAFSRRKNIFTGRELRVSLRGSILWHLTLKAILWLTGHLLQLHAMTFQYWSLLCVDKSSSHVLRSSVNIFRRVGQLVHESRLSFFSPNTALAPPPAQTVSSRNASPCRSPSSQRSPTGKTSNPISQALMCSHHPHNTGRKLKINTTLWASISINLSHIIIAVFFLFLYLVYFSKCSPCCLQKSQSCCRTRSGVRRSSWSAAPRSEAGRWRSRRRRSRNVEPTRRRRDGCRGRQRRSEVVHCMLWENRHQQILTVLEIHA